MNKKRVLFLCTRNSARSQMAEAILRRLAGHNYDVFSAGTHPKDVNPRTRDIMKEIDIDIGAQASKNVPLSRAVAPVFKGPLGLPAAT